MRVDAQIMGSADLDGGNELLGLFFLLSSGPLVQPDHFFPPQGCVIAGMHMCFARRRADHVIRGFRWGERVPWVDFLTVSGRWRDRDDISH